MRNDLPIIGLVVQMVDTVSVAEGAGQEACPGEGVEAVSSSTGEEGGGADYLAELRAEQEELGRRTGGPVVSHTARLLQAGQLCKQK